MFSCEVLKFLETPILKNICERILLFFSHRWTEFQIPCHLHYSLVCPYLEWRKVFSIWKELFYFRHYNISFLPVLFSFSFSSFYTCYLFLCLFFFFEHSQIPEYIKLTSFNERNMLLWHSVHLTWQILYRRAK